MTIKIQFNYDEKSLWWEKDLDERCYFVRSEIMYLRDKREINGCISLMEICERFGVACPTNLLDIQFPYKDDDLLIDYDLHELYNKDFTTIKIEYSYD